jgi:hypothetical protein
VRALHGQETWHASAHQQECVSLLLSSEMTASSSSHSWSWRSSTPHSSVDPIKGRLLQCYVCRFTGCHINLVVPSDGCTSTFRSRSWTTWSHQQFSTRAALQLPHHLQTLLLWCMLSSEELTAPGCVRYGHTMQCLNWTGVYICVRPRLDLMERQEPSWTPERSLLMVRKHGKVHRNQFVTFSLLALFLITYLSNIVQS